MIRVARVYDEPRRTRAYRALVDRLWPRGMKKEDVAFDEWCKDAAPSGELRRWYGHDPGKFEDFARRYRRELRRRPAADAIAHLRAIARDERELTLLTATKDVEHSAARVLCEYLAGKRHR